MSSTSRALGGLRPVEFLAQHWQKRPRLARSAFDGLERLLTPERLAALACEAHVEARLVLRRDVEPAWQVRHGPFRPRDFDRLPADRWTLLVQEVDRLLPEVAALLEPFRFLPNWRLDDVMVSYATPGGSVGPHIDHYDVFLIQALGRRRWSVGAGPLREERLLPGIDLRVLERFEEAERWVLDPGDLLYLPPRVAHHGVALDPCMTLSLGFYAPSHRELFAGMLSSALEQCDEAERYADPEAEPQADPGRITPQTLDRVRRILGAWIEDDAALCRWFGRLVTRPRREHSAPAARRRPSSRAVRQAIEDGALLRRDALPRFAHCGTRLYVGGTEYELGSGRDWAGPLLCGRRRLDLESLRPHLADRAFLALLGRLIAAGHLVVERGR